MRQAVFDGLLDPARVARMAKEMETEWRRRVLAQSARADAASPGGGLSLVRAGCILSDNLSPQKARVLLMVALSITGDPAEIKKYFQR